jgi:hypothetical protein
MNTAGSNLNTRPIEAGTVAGAKDEANATAWRTIGNHGNVRGMNTGGLNPRTTVTIAATPKIAGTV